MSAQGCARAPSTCTGLRSVFICRRLWVASPLGDLDAARVRRWRAQLLDQGVSANVVAKAYRLLRAILMTAVDDRLIPRNPCRIRGAGTEPTSERPVLTVRQVYDLARSMPADTSLGLMVLVTTLGSLHWGEVTALRRVNVDEAAGVPFVVERVTGIEPAWPAWKRCWGSGAWTSSGRFLR